MTIDIGQNSLRFAVALPNDEIRQLSLNVNNESEKETANAIAFLSSPPYFILGSSASSVESLVPSNVVRSVNRLLGQTFDTPAAISYRHEVSPSFLSHFLFSILIAFLSLFSGDCTQFPFVPFVPDPSRSFSPSGTQAIGISFPAIPGLLSRSSDPWSPEELMAMFIAQARVAVNSSFGFLPDHCALTVPSFYDPSQRSALKDAATIAGESVQSHKIIIIVARLSHSTLAVPFHPSSPFLFCSFPSIIVFLLLSVSDLPLICLSRLWPCALD